MKSKFTAAVLLFLLFVGLIFCVKRVDVAPIGAEETEVGFSTLNGWAQELFGVHPIADTLSNFLLLAVLAVAAVFALIGAVELFREKSLFKVDPEILAKGGVYLLIAFSYLFFELFPVNYRPILEEGETFPEPSFPSSHVLISTVVLFGTLIVLNRYLRAGWLRTAAKIILPVGLVCMPLLRLLSGVHWLTDVLGALLLGGSLVFLFWGIMGLIRRGEEKSEREEDTKRASRRII